MGTWKIVANTIYYGVVPKLTFLASLVVTPLITPFLTPADYGIQGVISSYTSLLAVIAPLGFHVHLTNSFYEYKENYRLVWGRVLYIFLVSGIVFGLVDALLLWLVLPMEPSLELAALCLLGAIPVLLFGNNLVASHLFPLLARPQPLVLTNLLCSLAGTALLFTMVYGFHLGYWGLIAAGGLSAILSFGIFARILWTGYHIKPIMERNARRFTRMLKVALPLIPHALGFVLLTSSSRIVMTWYQVPLDEIGLFTHGCAMGEMGMFLTTALTTALAPQIQTAYRNGNLQAYRKLYYICQLVSLTVSVMICLWMQEIYTLLIRNDELSMSANIATLMCFANVVYPFYTFMSVPAFIEKNTLQLLWLVFVPGLLNIAICAALIPVWGYKVAIYSTMLSYWSQLAIPLWNRFYKQHVGAWLGSLDFGGTGARRCEGAIKLLAVAGLFAGCVLLFNYINHVALGYKVAITLMVLMLFGSIYSMKKLYKVL